MLGCWEVLLFGVGGLVGMRGSRGGAAGINVEVLTHLNPNPEAYVMVQVGLWFRVQVLGAVRHHSQGPQSPQP